jgi:ribonuclease HI
MTKPTHKASGKLFEEPEAPSARAEGAYTANIDGAARGNPGPAAYGVIVRRPDGSTHESLGKYIGHTTNNVAEYYALIAALDYAAASGIRRLRVYSDSQLIVNQIKGLYKVKHPDLRPLHERAKKQAATLETFTIQYVPREQNRDADDLANAALDNTGGVKPAYGAAPAKTASPVAKGALYLEDLHVGQKFTSGTYRMDESRIKEFAAEFGRRGGPAKRFPRTRRERLAHGRGDHAPSGYQRPAVRRRAGRPRRRSILGPADASWRHAAGGKRDPCNRSFTLQTQPGHRGRALTDHQSRRR